MTRKQFLSLGTAPLLSRFSFGQQGTRPKNILLLMSDQHRPHAMGVDGNAWARTPNLDALAATAECGVHLPIGFGITPGSAPGHLALFGYDPLEFPIGRGVVAATGVAFPMKAGDVAARLNFATLDAAGAISDRRAGRIPTDKCAQLCELLKAVSNPR